MKKLLTGLLLVCLSAVLFAQKEGEKKTVKEKLEQLPEMLIAQPDQGPDTNANKLISDKVSMEINPLWKTSGTLFFNDFKLQKTDKEPLDATMPLPEKKLVQAVTINLSQPKKTAAERKEMVMKEIKTHLASLYKEAGTPLSTADLNAKTQAMIIGTENFTTQQGRQGELVISHDIQTAQSELVLSLYLPDSQTGQLTFAQIRFLRYNYETNLPDDVLEWRTFAYADEQEVYVNFAKKMLSTIVVR